MEWNLDEAIGYYKALGAPNDQTALVGLLREIQRESGGSVPLSVIGRIAEVYQIKETFLFAIIKRFPSLRLGNTHTLELCAGPNCGKQTELAIYAEKLLESSGQAFILKFVPCMRMCGKGPNIKWDGKTHHKADRLLLERLLEESSINFER